MQRVKQSHAIPILAICLFFLVPSQSIKFSMQIGGFESQCFYEVMNEGQKYSYKATPKNSPMYYVGVFQQGLNDGWENLYEKHINVGLEKIEMHKLAVSAKTYAFCIKNQQKDALDIEVQFHTGIHLMQFSLLPDKSDTQNLEKEIEWLEGGKKSFFSILQKVQEQKIKNRDSSALLSVKMIISAIIGLISVVLVNALFFKNMKNEFRRRKLI